MDLSSLTIANLAIVLIVVTAMDTLSGFLDAINNRTFSLAYVATFLETHVLKRIFPIIGLALISKSLGTDGVGAVVWALALGGLAAYVLETVKSFAANLPTTTSTGLPTSIG